MLTSGVCHDRASNERSKYASNSPYSADSPCKFSPVLKSGDVRDRDLDKLNDSSASQALDTSAQNQHDCSLRGAAQS